MRKNHINRNFMTLKAKDIVKNKVRYKVAGKNLQSLYLRLHSEDHVPRTNRIICPFNSTNVCLKKYHTKSLYILLQT